MSDQYSHLDQAFVEQQRKRLAALREQIMGPEVRRLDTDRALQAEHGEESGDEAQRLAESQVYQALHDVDERRRWAIDRALQKINEGTYGFSDKSGLPIPIGRLESTPEAVLTVEEEEQEERRQRR
jgi:DnaK suppressor protein